MTAHATGTRDEWLAKRKDLLQAEKDHMREGDELARRRRDLPWVPIDREYGFDTDAGTKTLAELFGRRSQLLVYHFMFGVGLRVTDETGGCTGCSFVADHFDAVVPHLNGHGVAFVCASLAPLEHLRAYKQRMGWRFPWVSSLGSDFNFDFGVVFTDEQQASGAEYNFRHVDQPEPQRDGVSAFAIEDGVVHHLLRLRPRGRGADGHLPVPRPDSGGPQRGRAAVPSGLVAPPRRARAAMRFAWPGAARDDRQQAPS
jgi:predicted dithiol-disulfide oxidoreductase (DUF899 family)